MLGITPRVDVDLAPMVGMPPMRPPPFKKECLWAALPDRPEMHCPLWEGFALDGEVRMTVPASAAVLVNEN